MNYIITTILIIVGLGYHVMQTIKKFKGLFPELPIKTIWATFFKEEWDSLIVSGLGYVLFQTLYFILVYNKVIFPVWFTGWGLYVLAAVWGYAGQRLSYSFLNTAEQVLEKKVQNIKDSNG